jgi:hypothetical protein
VGLVVAGDDEVDGAHAASAGSAVRR